MISFTFNLFVVFYHFYCFFPFMWIVFLFTPYLCLVSSFVPCLEDMFRDMIDFLPVILYFSRPSCTYLVPIHLDPMHANYESSIFGTCVLLPIVLWDYCLQRDSDSIGRVLKGFDLLEWLKNVRLGQLLLQSEGAINEAFDDYI